ncbi:hypothetical protein BDV09DRAFT_190319 [Aspergillus tetrazonus]
MTESWEFYSKALRAMIGLGVQRAMQQIQAVSHRWTETLPTGYKAVLVERNSHFNHLYVFPRFAVVPSREHTAFVPYDGIPSFGPRGILSHVRDSVSSLTPTQVRLASGKSIDYEYLAFATGTWQPPPSKASLTEKAEACAELKASQKRIQYANHIAKVDLVHSRAQLLPKFGPRLHEHVYKAMKQLNIDVVLGERPQLSGNGVDAEPGRLSFKDGRTAKYDLPIPCTGQCPNSGLLEKFVPAAFCPTTRQILVRPTLQIADPSNPNPRIFALGDVARTNDPGWHALHAPGRCRSSRWIYYGQDEKGKEVFVTGADKDENLKVQHVWEELGVKFEPTLPQNMK